MQAGRGREEQAALHSLCGHCTATDGVRVDPDNRITCTRAIDIVKTAIVMAGPTDEEEKGCGGPAAAAPSLVSKNVTDWPARPAPSLFL